VTTTADFLERLCGAVNAHDLDAVVGCFHDDYRNDTPVHPGRGFVGAEQVRTNWSRLFAGVPDMKAAVVAHTIDGETVWSEWEMSGTRPDGGPHLMRGVIVFGITEGRASWARFYLEPADSGDGGVDAAIDRIVSA